MTNTFINPDAFAKTVVGIFDEYGKEIMVETKRAVDVTARELVKETKETAPRKAIQGRAAGTFANHISSKIGVNTMTAYSRIWYVRSPEYRLAHLLNNGHALRQGGRWGGDPFITRASEKQATAFEKRVMEGVRRAGR